MFAIYFPVMHDYFVFQNMHIYNSHDILLVAHELLHFVKMYYLQDNNIETYKDMHVKYEKD